jgi:hypothetical protein
VAFARQREGITLVGAEIAEQTPDWTMDIMFPEAALRRCGW